MIEMLTRYAVGALLELLDGTYVAYLRQALSCQFTSII